MAEAEKTCPECNGDGVIDQGTDDEMRCPTCNGTGVVPDDGQDSEEVWNANPPSPSRHSLSADSPGALFQIGRYPCRAPRPDSPAGFLRLQRGIEFRKPAQVCGAGADKVDGQVKRGCETSSGVAVARSE
jgi:hypothetical protein